MVQHNWQILGRGNFTDDLAIQLYIPTHRISQIRLINYEILSKQKLYLKVSPLCNSSTAV